MAKPVQVANVTIELEGAIAKISVPSFTREADELKVLVDQIWSTYVTRSEIADLGMSLADFGMFVLSSSTTEPREQ